MCGILVFVVPTNTKLNTLIELGGKLLLVSVVRLYVT